MTLSTSSRTKRLFTWLLGLTVLGIAATIGGYLWQHRVELFQLPAAWREVQRLQRLPSERGAFRDAVERLLRCNLRANAVALRGQPEIESIQAYGGQALELVTASCEIRDRDSERGSTSSATYAFLLDARGRLIDHVSTVFPLTEKPVRFGQSGPQIFVGDSARYGEFEYSVDARGFVPRGWFLRDELRTPVDYKSVSGVRLDGATLAPFFASGRRADLFWTLWKLDRADAVDNSLGAELFSHPDDEIRARAVAVLGGMEPHRRLVPSFVNDPSPRVRLAALYVLVDQQRETDYAVKLLGDSHRVVAMTAARHLAKYAEPKIARRGFLGLLRSRDDGLLGDGGDASWIRARCRQLGSQEAAEALVTWMEDVDFGSGSWESLARYLGQCRGDHLRPIGSRLLALSERLDTGRDSHVPVLIALLRLEDEAADGVMNELLASDRSGAFWSAINDPYRYYGSPLISRARPLSGAIDILWEIGDPSAGPWHSTNDARRLRSPATDALLVLAKWGDRRSRRAFD